MNAQSFEQGKNYVEFDLGLGLYTDVTNDIRFNSFSRTYKDQAASTIIGLQYERAVTNVMGIGLRVASQKYLDSAGKDNVDASNFDVGLVVYAHFLSAKKVDLYANLTLGLTSLKIDDNRSSAKYEGNGSYVNLGLGARFFLGNSLYLSPKLEYSSMNVTGDYLNVFNNEVKGEWSAKGTIHSIGLGVKI